MLVLASCAGGAERKYAVPERLCGLDLGQENYAALFGPGEKLEKDSLAEWGEMHVTTQGCRYLVDGLPRVDVNGYWAKQHDEVAPSTPHEQIKAHNTPEKPRRYKGGRTRWPPGPAGLLPLWTAGGRTGIRTRTSPGF
ncbi:hypothetical protein IHE61_13205 [Streptomyces sp. GKU 257-1]|nr:hypothetical protein [Streptomyces sp. GKU 257-1]